MGQNHQNSKKNRDLSEILDAKQPYELFDSIEDTLVLETLIKSDLQKQHLSRIQGSLVGLAVGDALGAPVEFKPHAYVEKHPISDMISGGTWGLQAGQWTDDTSMALCLTASIIIKKESNIQDQLERYLRWYRDGYLSSTGKCFDIGNSTRKVLEKFEFRLKRAKEKNEATVDLSRIGDVEGAGNGCLMRLAPLALFYSFASISTLMEAVRSATEITHADKKAIDACCFFAVLVCSAAQGKPKDKILDPMYFRKFYQGDIHKDVQNIIDGSYKKKPNGYQDGIRATGFVINTLEAALWAFYHDGGSFEKGVLDVIRLGDDTDTVAAVYGQLAGACYGLDRIPSRWRTTLFQGPFITALSTGLYWVGDKCWNS